MNRVLHWSIACNGILFALALGLWLRGQVHTPHEVVPVELKNREQIEFVHSFFDKFFQYSSESYLAQQAAILPLLKEPLLQSQRRETQKTALKLSQQKIEQKHQLIALTQVAEHQYEGRHRIELAHLQEGRKIFFILSHLQIQESERTPDNPRGWTITQLKLEPDINPKPAAKLLLHEQQSLFIDLPCRLQKLEGDNLEAIKIKVAANEKSTLELTPEKSWNGNSQLRMSCAHGNFQVDLAKGEKTQDVYRIISVQSQPQKFRKKENSNQNILTALLQKQLGFVVEPLENSK